jgi:mortality factor 4-like protein 1
MGSTDKTKPKLNTSVTSVSNSLTPIQSDIKENPVVVKDSDVQRKKRRIETTVEHEDSGAIKKSEIKIKIPDSLKQILVNDWDQIRQKKLIRLPQKVTVDRILNDYLKHKNSTKLSASKQSSITEAVNGIKEYFKATIGTQLLYKFEKNQFNEHIKDPDDDSTKASAIYGAIHLLRLFGQCLTHSIFNLLFKNILNKIIISIFKPCLLISKT